MKLLLISALVAILTHELGHALAAYSVGCKVHGFRVLPYPAVRIENPHHALKNAWIALGGPAMNLLLSCVGFAVWFWIWIPQHYSCAPIVVGVTGQLVVATLSLLPYPKSDTWRAFEVSR